jgi:hypothetical protein|nr:hypothetical protein [Candidatus Krumholzibacteria bacterium]
MRGLLDLWATIFRNTRALSAAVLIWAAVFIAWGMKCQRDRDPMLEVTQERGRVVEVLGEKPAAPGESDFGMRPLVIMLADSTTIQLLVPAPLPHEGDMVPLRVEVFQSGKKSYSFDTQEWIFSGAG